VFKTTIIRNDGQRFSEGEQVYVAHSEDGFASCAIGVIMEIDDGEYPVLVALKGARKRYYFKVAELEHWNG
jgi:hypothetical protein